MRESMFNFRGSHLWAWDNPHAILECGYEVSFSMSIWDGNAGDIAVGPCLLEAVSVAVRQRLWFQHFGTPHATCLR